MIQIKKYVTTVWGALIQNALELTAMFIIIVNANVHHVSAWEGNMFNHKGEFCPITKKLCQEGYCENCIVWEERHSDKVKI